MSSTATPAPETAGKAKSPKTIPAIAANPKGRYGAHRIVEGRTLCGIDARNWMAYEKSDKVTCPYCLIREKHGITKPTSYEALPEAAKKEITKKMAALKKAAASDAAKEAAKSDTKVEETASDEAAAPDAS